MYVPLLLRNALQIPLLRAIAKIICAERLSPGLFDSKASWTSFGRMNEMVIGVMVSLGRFFFRL